MGGIHAIEHAAIGIFPLLVLTDRNDLGGISIPYHPQVQGPAVFIYDGVPGGAGLSRQAFQKAEALLKYTFNAIKDCSCENGCPSCVHSPKCGSGNRPIDKAAACFILSRMLGEKITVPNRSTEFQKAHNENNLLVPDKPISSENAYELKQENQSFKKRFDPPVRKRSAKALRLKRKQNSFSISSHTVINNKTDDIDEHFCILDIETQFSAEEVGGWHRADLMKVSCAVLYDSMADQYLEFTEERVLDLVDCLKAFNRVVGFNIKRFDYRVLSGYTDFDFKTIPTLDILEDVHQHLGYRLSLDHLSKTTLGAKKTADGLQALKWWKQGRVREIMAYCKADVKITKELYLYGKTNGYLLFTNKAKHTVRVPVKW